MGLRGLIKDILFIYLAYLILKLWWQKEQVSTGVLSLTVVILLLVIWFMLERIGLMPKTI